MYQRTEGKTESTKHVLRFLTSTSSKLAAEVGADGVLVNDIERLINVVNPITESFGNAKVGLSLCVCVCMSVYISEC